MSRNDIVRLIHNGEIRYGKVIHIDLETGEFFIDLLNLVCKKSGEVTIRQLDKELDTPPFVA